MDKFTLGMMTKTAESFEKLAALRGLTISVTVREGHYYANGNACGPSVHGMYEWLEKQPGVKP